MRPNPADAPILAHCEVVELLDFDVVPGSAAGRDGPPGSLLFLHGWDQDKTALRGLGERLCPPGAEAIYPTLRGHGDSPRGIWGYAPWELAVDVQRIGDRLPVPVHVVGYSYGALIAALATVILGPERVASLVLLDQSFERNDDQVGWVDIEDSFLQWHFDHRHVLDAITALGVPTMLVVAARGTVVGAAERDRQSRRAGPLWHYAELDTDHRGLVADLDPLAVVCRDFYGSIEPPGGGRRVEASGRASLIQEWFMSAGLRDPEAPPLQCCAAYFVGGDLDLEAVRQAAQDVVFQHPSLRTGFEVLDEGKVRQVVFADGEVEFLTPSLPPGCRDRRRAAIGLLEREVGRRFDRGAPPLVRLVAIDCGSDGWLLGFVLDHMVADGWSLEIVLGDFAIAYRARRAGSLPRFEAAGSYLRFAAEQRERFEQGRGQELADFWATRLDPERGIELTFPGHRRAASLSGSSMLRFVVPRDDLERLDLVARELAATKYVVALAALQVTLARLTGRTRITTLTSCANRSDHAQARTVGWFANGVFPTVGIDLDAPLRSLVRATEAAVFEAVDHGDMPAWHVRRKLHPDLDAGFRREPGVYFMYRELGRSDFLLDDLDLEQIEPAVTVDTPGIQFWLAEREDRIEVEVLHYLSEYPLDVAEAAARSYLDVLTALIADPERPVGRIVDDALGQGEKGEIRV